jgi:hypothetical protein
MAQPKAKDKKRSFSTTLVEPEVIEIDNQDYEVYGREHVGKNEEVTLLSAYREFGYWAERNANIPEGENPRERVAESTENMQRVRYEILQTFTNIPQAVLDVLPPDIQGEILDIVAEKMGFTQAQIEEAKTEGREQPDSK